MPFTCDPKEAATIIGKVEKTNYLAHSIREMESRISNILRKNYRICVYHSNLPLYGKIYYRERCCDIRITSECEEKGDKWVRLILAHELGHLVFNINHLNSVEVLKNPNPSDEEELFAWMFAFHLMNVKSEEYREHIQLQKFIYPDSDIKQTLKTIIEKSIKPERPNVYDNIVQSLKLQ